jgi:predicted acyltransferase
MPDKLNTTADSNTVSSSKPRLVSLDALRGFDMFWIIGGEGLFTALFGLTGWAGWQVASAQMQHSQWHGFTFYDLIFPLFIFLSGVPLGLGPKRLDKLPYQQRIPLYRHALKRLLLLIALGVLYNHGWGAGIPIEPEQIRFSSVLERIGFAWFFAAILVWHTSLRTQITLAISLLIFYAVLQCFIPFPGGQAGVFTLEGSINTYVDSVFRPGITYQQSALDPEGVLSTLPAIINALIGVFVGQFILKPQPKGEWAKVIKMLLAALLLWSLGWLLDPVIPVNKVLWSTSFILVTAGWSLLLFSAFYAIIDVLKWRSWAYVFVVIGTNAIIVYIGSSLIDWFYISRSLFWWRYSGCAVFSSRDHQCYRFNSSAVDFTLVDVPPKNIHTNLNELKEQD